MDLFCCLIMRMKDPFPFSQELSSLILSSWECFVSFLYPQNNQDLDDGSVKMMFSHLLFIGKFSSSHEPNHSFFDFLVILFVWFLSVLTVGWNGSEIWVIFWQRKLLSDKDITKILLKYVISPQILVESQSWYPFDLCLIIPCHSLASGLVSISSLKIPFNWIMDPVGKIWFQSLWYDHEKLQGRFNPRVYFDINNFMILISN